MHRRFFPIANLLFILFAVCPAFRPAKGATIDVLIENLGADGSTTITPVFAGFHDGTFNLFDVGSAASAQLEALAEDGNTGPLSMQFSADRQDTLVEATTPPLIGPGQSATASFQIDLNGPPTRLLLATMILPSSDLFLSNDNINGFDLSGLTPGGQLQFDLNRLYDAGTETNDFALSAGNGLLGLAGGQTGPNQGTDENGVVSFLGLVQADGTLQDAMGNPVTNPLSSFVGAPADFSPALAPIRVTVTAVPEPSVTLAVGLAVVGLIHRHRKRRVAT